eukprot:TRINITY_DN23234_c0_g1_i6.p1 TRINITY_DN23234_c0_g1~~TRINITY_DN23234_c0_g1_i6.p1  ORF type:complete len:263 (-),score=77.10 TRINITY_DN23234_c0_g1_i6:14-802(-)
MVVFFFLMIRRPPRSTQGVSSAASDVYKRQVMKRYFKDPEKTKEAIDVDGWLHSGDVACIMPGGVVKIIDRKKSIFKLAQGEYVAPEKLENHFGNCGYISQSFVYGDSLKSYIIAIVHPTKEKLLEWAQEKGIEGDFSTLCRHPEAEKMILEEMEKISIKEKHSRIEFVKKVHLISEPFSPENNTMTPSLKLKRFNAKKMFEKEIMLSLIHISEPTRPLYISYAVFCLKKKKKKKQTDLKHENKYVTDITRNLIPTSTMYYQ